MSTKDSPSASPAPGVYSHADVSAIPIQVSRGIIVASIQQDLDEEVVACFREDLLGRIHGTDSAGVILDVSGLHTLDIEEFSALRRIISMSEIMGARPVLVGLQPGVVSSLVEMDADVSGLSTALDLDAAYCLLDDQSDAGDEETAAIALEESEDSATLPKDEGMLFER